MSECVSVHEMGWACHPYVILIHSSLSMQCSPSEFCSLVRALARVQREFQSFSEMALSDLHSELVQQAVKEVCDCTPSLLGS